jgi:leucyl aminopeptidase
MCEQFNGYILPKILPWFLYSARSVARDIGGSDPERMAPPNVEEYVRSMFQNSDIKMEVISDPKVLNQEYPLFEAVDRAASGEYCVELVTWFFYSQEKHFLCYDS